MNTQEKITTISDRQKWLIWRRSGIGSSDAAAIHNRSPYLTKLECHVEKASNDITEEESNFAMNKGNQFEPIARKIFSAEYNMENNADEDFQPRLLIHAEFPFMIASLDGAKKDLTETCEIKYQGKEAHLKLADESLDIKLKIKEYYWIQMQHQLFVSGAKFCWFVSYNPDCAIQLLKCKVYPDEDFFKTHIAECSKFWAGVQANIAPELSEKDFKLLTKKGAKAIAKRMISIKESLSVINAEYDTLKTELLTMVDHPKMRILSLRINQTNRAGSIQYKDIPEVKALPKETLEKYRGSGSSFYVVTLDKNAEDEIPTTDLENITGVGQRRIQL